MAALPPPAATPQEPQPYRGLDRRFSGDFRVGGLCPDRHRLRPL